MAGTPETRYSKNGLKHQELAVEAPRLKLELNKLSIPGVAAEENIKGPDNPTCVFFRKSVAVDTSGSLSKGTSECASVSQ